ncbi:hypothetical protein [Aureimonas jatrophae]|uniref:Uncharacterized protein n=1 Tax=Aureimonas jatrophae TaxID=1166073 RepID=A0A1H0LVV2_9HYPH|nr:hypothetical protein [Aureimonas jatrophae]MBB3952772.1 hypothetical protein [Aureimonas jatrophae]SDO72332.1 hypothetical protein SAMN05192530_11181 [Aureimonas jatrophae]
MRHTHLAPALALGLALLGQSPAEAKTYTNPTYGTSASFPEAAFPQADPAPPGGEGGVWRSPDGAELVIYAFENAKNYDPARLVAWRRTVDRVTYQKRGGNWAVVSGYRPDGRIFYERYIFRGDLIHSVSIRYPEALRDPYDDLVGPVAHSLRAPAR